MADLRNHFKTFQIISKLLLLDRHSPGDVPSQLVKCPDEGVRVFVPQQIRGLVQFERGVQQVVLCHLPPRFFHQALKRKSLCEQVRCSVRALTRNSRATSSKRGL